tara:strand:- start:304 stop:2313 length:2010 start_codon:yes stop_codon:yes gene_type:complete
MKINYSKIRLVTNTLDLDNTFQRATLQEAIAYCKSIPVVGYDIETTRLHQDKWLNFGGLDPYTSDIVMVQVGDLNRQYVIDARCVDIGELREVFCDLNTVIVGHNLKFEYKHTLHKYKVRLNAAYDTMVAERILFNGLPEDKQLSLKALNERYLDIEVDKSIRLSFLTIGDRPFTVDEIAYGAADILYPLWIREKQLKDFKNKDLWETMKLEMKFLLALADIEYTGVNFNPTKWLDTYEVNMVHHEGAILELDKFIMDNYSDTQFVCKQYDMFTDGFSCKIQWSSSNQVIEFFRYLKICPEVNAKPTKTEPDRKKKFTVESKEVKAMMHEMALPKKLLEFVSLYLEAKKHEQSVTTFGNKFLKNVNPVTGRLHSNYKQIINTGRIASSGPNLQNIPSDPAFRKAFDAPENKVIVNADYSGQESIVLVNSSMDENLLEFYEGGKEGEVRDMHSFIASKLFPSELAGMSLGEIKEKRSDLRQIAKAAGFALAYGGTGFTIAKNLGLAPEVGEKVYEDYFKAFPGMNAYFEGVKKAAIRTGFILIDDITKRKYYYPDWKWLKQAERNGEHKKASQLRGKMERAAMNYPIQGQAGSITKLAAIYLYEWLGKANLWEDVKVTLLVHDEINLEVTDGYQEVAGKALEECMERAGAVWCKRIPLKADAITTSYWTH